MTGASKSGARYSSSNRRIVVVLVPPVDELDLVGPLQVFNSVNRLAGRNITRLKSPPTQTVSPSRVRVEC
jgi:hypothetical protein